MSRRVGFWLCFSILALIGLFPALRLSHCLDRRLLAIEYQHKVDLKRERIAPLLEALGKIRSNEADREILTDPTGAWLNLYLPPGGDRTEDFLRFLAVDGQGAVILSWKRSIDSSSGWQPENFEHSFDLDHPARTRSTGNVIRGLDGFSLKAYRDLEGALVHGAWVWDRTRKRGLIAEIPAEPIEQEVKSALAPIRLLRRVLPPAMILAGLAFALLAAWGIQRWMKGGNIRVSSSLEVEDAPQA